MAAAQVRMLIVRQPTGVTRCFGFVSTATEATKAAISIRYQFGLPVTRWRTVGVGSRIQSGDMGAGWWILDMQVGYDVPEVHEAARLLCLGLGGPRL
jgi:hypothetical protein